MSGIAAGALIALGIAVAPAVGASEAPAPRLVTKHSAQLVRGLGSFTPGFLASTGLAALKVAARPLATALYEWSTAQLRREFIEAARISDDELMLLERHRRGFTTKRIARMTGLTHASIDMRFQRLIARLDVPNRRDAARLASEYGLI